jgi:putative polyhydroxyalkanoate system protein
MPDITMTKRHSLPMARARELVQQAADDLAAEFDLRSQWAGDTLHFRRTGVQGQMRVTESEIDLEVTLGFLLRAFKSRFVENIERIFDTLLAEAHAAQKAAPGRDRGAPRRKAAVKTAKKTVRKG